MANYNSLKNAAIIAPTSTPDLGSATNRYGNVYMSGNINMSGTSLTSTNVITPRVASIAYLGNDTAANPTGGQIITLNGSGFATGASVYVGGTIVGSVSVISSIQLTFVSPAKTAGSYSLNVVNADGASTTFISGMQYSGTPAWTTAAGSLGSVAASGSANFTVAATSDSTVTYSVYSGSLPSGVTLNSSTGFISGTAPTVGSDTTYNFTIRATDSENQDTDRNFSIAVSVAVSIEYLVIAGGGSGSAGDGAGIGSGGGGGAGGLLTSTTLVNPGTQYTITVGAGGNGDAVSGDNSSITGIATAYGGGGGGGSPSIVAKSGGSGGGGGKNMAAGKGVYPGSSYISAARQGYDGGTGSTYGGGGGGAGAVGNSGSSGTISGGAGLYSSISGASTAYASGGGSGFAGTNAVGGGGTAGSPGTANTGGGGGQGAGYSGGKNGGSGIVIIRYSDAKLAASATTGSPTITVAGGYRVYKFTSSGSITF